MGIHRSSVTEAIHRMQSATFKFHGTRANAEDPDDPHSLTNISKNYPLGYEHVEEERISEKRRGHERRAENIRDEKRTEDETRRENKGR